mgnify:CR=1 FL=1
MGGSSISDPRKIGPGAWGVMHVFIWTVDLHNYVNRRLHKEHIDVQDALKLWSGENVCLEDCGEESIEIDVDKLPKVENRDSYKVF